jgi:hypothetical protein
MFRKAQYLPVSEDDPKDTPLDQRPINKRTRNYGAIALAIVLITGVIVLAILKTNDHASNKTSTKKGVENFRHQQPELITVLKHDWQVGSLLHSNDKPWEKEHLLVPNGGFIVREIRGKKYYHGITMFHQLHCLAHVRSTMQLLIATLNGTVAIDADGKPKSHEDLIQEVLDGHASHCFDYLKQVRRNGNNTDSQADRQIDNSMFRG